MLKLNSKMKVLISRREEKGLTV